MDKYLINYQLGIPRGLSSIRYMGIENDGDTPMQRHNRELLASWGLDIGSHVIISRISGEIDASLCPSPEEQAEYDASNAYRDSFNRPTTSPLHSSEIVVRQLQEFGKYYTPQKIYYPCCWSDISVSIAFPNTEVIYADLDRYAIDLLRKGGYTAHREDVTIFSPEGVDIILLLNPVVSADVFIDKIQVGGYIICGAYLGTANRLMTQIGFDLQGRVDLEGENPIYRGIPEKTGEIAPSGDSLYVFQRKS